VASSTPVHDSQNDYAGDDDFNVFEQVSVMAHSKSKSMISALKKSFWAMEPNIRMRRAKRALAQVVREMDLKSPTCHAIGRSYMELFRDSLDGWYWETWTDEN